MGEKDAGAIPNQIREHAKDAIVIIVYTANVPWH